MTWSQVARELDVQLALEILALKGTAGVRGVQQHPFGGGDAAHDVERKRRTRLAIASEYLVIFLLKSAVNDTAFRLQVCGHIRARVRSEGARCNLGAVGKPLRGGCRDDGNGIIHAPCRPLLPEGVLEAALHHVSLATGISQNAGNI